VPELIAIKVEATWCYRENWEIRHFVENVDLALSALLFVGGLGDLGSDSDQFYIEVSKTDKESSFSRNLTQVDLRCGSGLENSHWLGHLTSLSFV